MAVSRRFRPIFLSKPGALTQDRMLLLPPAHERQFAIKERLALRIADAPGAPIACLHAEIPELPEKHERHDCLLVGGIERTPLLIAAQVGGAQSDDGLRVPSQARLAQRRAPEKHGDVI